MSEREDRKCLSILRTVTLLAFLLLLIPQAVSQTETIVNVVVNETASAELSFSINPTSAYQNQNIDFIITVENTGNVVISARPEIKIYSSEVLIANLTFESANIPIRSNVTFVTSWNTGNLGNYTAMAIVYYDNKTLNATQSFSIIAPPAPPTAPVARGVLILPPIIPPEEGVLRYIKHPILAELRPGETIMFDVTIKNPTRTSLNLDVDVSGIPWIDVFPSTIDVPATSTATFRIYVSIPFNASPNDYKVTITVSNAIVHAENFFILRIKPYPPAYSIPTVTRAVVLDMEKQITHVYLKITNPGGFVKKFEVVEEIPKSIASMVHQIDFDAPPTKILEYDPVVKWVLEDLETGETRRISYRVNVVLDEYSPYVYWPFKQVNIFYIKPEKMLEVSYISPSIVPGEIGKVLVTITNLDIKPVNIVARIEPLPDWTVSPEEITTTLPAGSSSTLIFSVTSPSTARAANYYLVLRLTYDNKEIVDRISILVQSPLPLSLHTILSLITVIAIIGAVSYVKWRAGKIYRVETVRMLKRIKQEIKRP